MNILNKIVENKKREVEERKELYPTRLLERSIYFDTPIVSMKKYLLRDDKSGIIAEFKKKSPSKGDINPYASVEKVSIGYMQSGASALSVLTDSHFFGGKKTNQKNHWGLAMQAHLLTYFISEPHAAPRPPFTWFNKSPSTKSWL